MNDSAPTCLVAYIQERRCLKKILRPNNNLNSEKMEFPQLESLKVFARACQDGRSSSIRQKPS